MFTLGEQIKVWSSNSYRGCLIWVRQNVPNETDMSETRGLLLKLIWVRRLKQSCKTHRWHWYDWDTSTQTCTDILRPPKKSSLFFILTQSQVCKIKCKNKIFSGVSVISVQVWVEVSQSYRSQLCFKRLTHIRFSRKPLVSLITVSFGSFCRTHIRHPPIYECNYNINNFILTI